MCIEVGGSNHHKVELPQDQPWAQAIQVTTWAPQFAFAGLHIVLCLTYPSDSGLLHPSSTLDAAAQESMPHLQGLPGIIIPWFHLLPFLEDHEG